jgi:hypothetical protein
LVEVEDTIVKGLVKVELKAGDGDARSLSFQFGKRRTNKTPIKIHKIAWKIFKLREHECYTFEDFDWKEFVIFP